MASKTFTIPLSVIPEAKPWKNGESYELEVEQVSRDDKSATFKLTYAGSEDAEEGDDTMYDRKP